MPRLVRAGIGALTAVLLAGASAALLALGWAAPAAAAPATARLSVTLRAEPAQAGPGQRVAYRIELRNDSRTPAARVRLEFTTSAPLTTPTTAVSAGHCYRSAAQVACLVGTIRAGGTAWATIDGTLPDTLAPGAVVRLAVTLSSDTTLADPQAAQATEEYQLPGGPPAGSALPASDAAPSGSAAVAAPGAGPDAFGLTLAGIAAVAAVTLVVAAVRDRRQRHAAPAGSEGGP